MLEFNQENIDVEAIAQELLNGGGAVLLKKVFSAEQINQARKIILNHSDHEGDKVTHFQGKAAKENNLHLQRRVWNLLNKGEVFIDMATHPSLMAVMGRFLGEEFIMGSIAANRILPNGPGQEPHIDYPYWDFHKQKAFPMALNSSFPLNAQATIILDPFTEETGASAYMPGSQKQLRYPQESDNFYDHCSYMMGEPGDVAVFFGAAWHCAMPNRSNIDRNAVLVQYLPKFVVPMENMTASLSSEILDQASPILKQLLGHNVPYPEILEAQQGGNAIGTN